MVTPTAILDIIILAYYFPAFLLAVYVGLKHGFERSAGWFNLNLLSIFRLLGSALGLAAIYHPNDGLYATSLVFSNMGTVSLLGALLGLLGRANQSLQERALPKIVNKYVHLAIIPTIVLAIVGGSYAWSSTADTRAYGHKLSKVSAILLIIIFVAAVGICAHTLALHYLVPQREKRLLHVCIISMPFVLVRLILAVCGTFDYSSTIFGMLSTSNSAIIVRALMGVLMEFIVVALFLWAGFTVDRSAERDAERAKKYSTNGLYQSDNGQVQLDRLSPQENGKVGV